MSKASTVRLRYLNDSAHTLAFSSPSTSAFLQARAEQLAEGGIPLEADADALPDQGFTEDAASLSSSSRHLDICASCGHDLTSTPLQFEPQKRAKLNKSDKAHRLHETTRKLYVECASCNATTQRTMERPKSDRKRQNLDGAQDHSPAPSKPATEFTARDASIASNALTVPSITTGRKRATGRKNNSLAAMVAKSKAEAESKRFGLGFDLMDLMKST